MQTSSTPTGPRTRLPVPRTTRSGWTAVRDYVPLGELEVGTVLHVQGGGEAILVSKTVAAGRLRGVRLRGRGAAQLLRAWAWGRMRPVCWCTTRRPPGH